MRVKLTTTHTTSRMSPPIFVVVSGLDRNQLKIPESKFEKCKGIYVLKVKGLSINSSSDPTNDGYSYIVFTQLSKNEEINAECNRYEFYRNKVLYNFIKDIKNAKYSNNNKNSEDQKFVLLPADKINKN